MTDVIHVAFRAAETGRFIFHGKWPVADYRKVQMAAEVMGISVEEFIHRAIDQKWARYKQERQSGG